MNYYGKAEKRHGERGMGRWGERAMCGLVLLFLSVLVFAQDAKKEFEIIEGHFHDGLGTHAELVLANALIAQAKLLQPRFDLTRSYNKMTAAMASLPEGHPSRTVFQTEITNIEQAAPNGARDILQQAGGTLTKVHHTARDFADARAGDLKLEFADRPPLSLSVKTDKSKRVAVAEGQTPDIAHKWAERYFRVTAVEFTEILAELGFSSLGEAKEHYLNLAQLVAQVLIRKLELRDCQPNDFRRARVGNLDAAKYLLRQLRHYKHGNDGSRVIIFDRTTGAVKWDSLLDGIDIEALTVERLSFLPSHPRGGRVIGSEFGLKVDGQTIVSFQIKHKRGKARGTARQYEFSDITTRLRL
ncbi:MAG: hypothetical protein JNM09_04050 [Blastocatellia bacterium]|nr:hypothetical protein [Blastocatellia bacterium]